MRANDASTCAPRTDACPAATASSTRSANEDRTGQQPGQGDDHPPDGRSPRRAYRSPVPWWVVWSGLAAPLQHGSGVDEAACVVVPVIFLILVWVFSRKRPSDEHGPDDPVAGA